MSPEAQRIAIAEARGTHTVQWFATSCLVWDQMGRSGRYWCIPPNGPAGFACDTEFIVPRNYTGDLNAMHEAEKVLTDSQWTDYANVLTDIAPCSRRGMIHATAAQRAEAFLRTIGKWEDGK